MIHPQFSRTWLKWRGRRSRPLRLLLSSAALAGLSCFSPPVLPADDEPKTTGRSVFVQHCARCHGPEGQGLIGPAVIGDKANLTNYKNAKGLLDYISSTMPQDKPGSLSDQQYMDVLRYLLLRNNHIKKPGEAIPDQLSAINL